MIIVFYKSWAKRRSVIVMARRSGVQLEHSLVSGALKSASFSDQSVPNHSTHTKY
jgi:hypothetical protein